MTARLTAGVAALALMAGAAQAQDLLFTPGEDDTFNWDSFDAFADAHDFSGERVTLSGP